MKIELTGVPETMLITLFARALESSKKEPKVRDAYAAEIVKNLEYDFGKYKKAKMSISGVIVRTLLFDEMARDFIKEHPDATIVNLGAGLDARFFRVDNGKILWYDLDLPEVMEVRKRFFRESGRCKMISGSMLDYMWIQEIENRDKPVLFIAEGLLMFFPGEKVKEFLGKLRENFSRGEIIADILSVFISKNSKRHDAVKKTKAEFCWGLNDPNELETFVPGITVKKYKDLFTYGRKHWMPFWLLSRIIFPMKKFLSIWIVNARLNKN